MGDARPDGVPDGAAADRRRVVGEVLGLTLVTLLLIRLVRVVVDAGAPELIYAAVPILFMYMPVWLCRLRGVDSYDYPLALPAFSDRQAWWEAVRLNLVVIGIILVPWLVGYHLYQTLLFGFEYEGTWHPEALQLIAYHVFFVAIPEEFFYRGYVQTRLDEVFHTDWRVLGARIGPGLLLTSVIFAFGHSVVLFQWWHFAIFFPSLVFGWMRARTGGVVAGALFHAWANVQVSILDSLYGVTY